MIPAAVTVMLALRDYTETVAGYTYVHMYVPDLKGNADLYLPDPYTDLGGGAVS